MSGYVASARIVRAAPRLARAGRDQRDVAAGPWPAGAAAAIVDAEATGRDAGAGGRAARLGARWAAFRERWAQLTFYLTSPNSWR